jgi:F5/8 type C domain/Domain of Unknown Function (DUF1080)
MHKELRLPVITTISLLFLMIGQFVPISGAYAKVSNHNGYDAPMLLPFGATDIGSCAKLPVNGVTAGGGQRDPSHPPKYAIDNNLNTRWSRHGLGSWIQVDLGKQMTICSIDIAWYRGDVRQNTFTISVSNDGSKFTNVFSGKSSGTTLSFETYTLPSNTNGRYVRITVTANTENTWASISELRINGYQSSTSPPPPTTNLYDDFDGTSTYTLAGGQTSPNGKWSDVYNGGAGGSAGVKDDGTGTGNKVFYMYPQEPPPAGEHTEASLVTSTKQWSNFDLSIDVKTVKQLRQGSPPNPWETAWVFFRYTDTFHFYAFLVKPDGIELEKKDCNSCTDPYQAQQYLVTESSPTLKIGSWSNWKISAIGNHIIITVDGNKVVDYVDQGMSSKLASGDIAMYNEDASAQFDNVYVTPR